MVNENSTRQKINITSITKAEVVAVHDVMATMLWMQYFLEKHRCTNKPSIIHEDNLAKHQDQVFLSDCNMIADFFTKPLTGAKFCHFSNITMNCVYDDCISVENKNTVDICHNRKLENLEPTKDESELSTHDG